MPTPMDAMLGLIVAAIGLLTLVVAFNVAEPKNKLFSYAIAGLVTVLGGYYYLSAEVRGFQMRRRISEIQQRQNVNLDEIRKRLEQNQPPVPQKNPGTR